MGEYTLYSRMAEAVSPVVTLSPIGTARRYQADQDILRAYLNRPDRDEDWAYTLRAALVGIQDLIAFDFEGADVAFWAVLEQCGE